MRGRETISEDIIWICMYKAQLI